ncbi:hypothetical protein [Chryseobacterium sp. R2A-55]|uniref:hypothetical protein n=1 Tax=Chryseobacterium sp. R2A-55 TaxID=2744445 RepID=UPI001F202A47|nr:hypothetical protein [Chryseobacterium sp. R2A-55]
MKLLGIIFMAIGAFILLMVIIGIASGNGSEKQILRLLIAGGFLCFAGALNYLRYKNKVK